MAKRTTRRKKAARRPRRRRATGYTVGTKRIRRRKLNGISRRRRKSTRTQRRRRSARINGTRTMNGKKLGGRLLSIVIGSVANKAAKFGMSAINKDGTMNDYVLNGGAVVAGGLLMGMNHDAGLGVAIAGGTGMLDKVLPVSGIGDVSDEDYRALEEIAMSGVETPLAGIDEDPITGDDDDDDEDAY